MKKFFTITFVALLVLIGMSISVQAAEVSTWDDLKGELVDGTDKTVTFTGSKTVTDTETLDLNGKTVILNNSLMVKGGNLTVTGNGKIFTSTVARMIDVYEGSTVTLENGTFETTVDLGAAVRVYGTEEDTGVKTNVTIGKDATIIANIPAFISNRAFGVKLNIDGTLKGVPYTHAGYCLYINGSVQATEGNVPEVNISKTASVISEKGPAVYAAGYGIWNITGGYLEGSEALSIKGGEFNITGGTFKATGKFDPNPDPNNNGTEPTGSTISITGNDDYAGKVKLNISNATVTSENGYALYEKTTNAVQPAVESISITSGNYSGKEGEVKVEEKKNFITGGTFNSGVEKDYLAGSTTTITGENGEILVVEKHDIIVETTKNGKVTASLTEAIKGQTVKLTVTPAEGYKLKGLKVNTPANNAVTVTDNSFIMPDSEVTVTAEFEKVVVVEPEQEETREEVKEEIKEEAKEEPVVEEKDNTPKTGAINVPAYVWVALATIALAGIVTTKKPSKHSK